MEKEKTEVKEQICADIVISNETKKRILALKKFSDTYKDSLDIIYGDDIPVERDDIIYNHYIGIYCDFETKIVETIMDNLSSSDFKEI